MKKISLPLVATVLFSLMLTSCVTVTESRLTRKASPEKAVENYTQLGLGYLERNHPDIARQRLQKALALNSKYAPANDAMGLVWQMEGEQELAEEFFKKAISDDNKFNRAHHHLGRLYLQQKKFDKAIKEISYASNDPYYEHRPEAFNDLALTYYHQNKVEQAINAYMQTLRLAPYNAEALLNISTLYFEQQDYVNALKYFDRFDRLAQREQVQHSAHSLWLGIKISAIQQNTERAIALASDLKRNFPKSEEYRLYRESLSGVH